VSTIDTRAPLLTRASPRVYAALREIVLIGSTFGLYELGRHLVGRRGALAFTDADSVVSAERLLHLPSEMGLQHALLSSESLVRAANVFYVSVHFPATIAFLVWMWVFRPRAYTWARSLLVSVTVVAFVLHVTFPLAPPRMLPGFVDTMAVYGPSAYGEGTQSVTNQYAAMPSLHAAWALIIAFVLVVSLRGRWRWLALLHPLVTTLVIVGTGNHYWLDVLAAGALVLIALGVHGVTPSSPARARPHDLATAA
jgi:PAP2 superfamily